MQILRPYLEGTHFDLYIDHQAVKWILSGSDHSGRLACWRLRLLEFDFSVAYKKSAKNTIEDAISRLPTYGEAQLAPDTEVPCYLIHGPASEVTPTDEGGAYLDAFCAETSYHTLDDTTYSSQVLEVETECPHLLKAEEFFDEDYDEVDYEDDIDAITATTEAEVTEPLAPLSLEEICRKQMKDDLCQKLRRKTRRILATLKTATVYCAVDLRWIIWSKLCYQKRHEDKRFYSHTIRAWPVTPVDLACFRHTEGLSTGLRWRSMRIKLYDSAPHVHERGSRSASTQTTCGYFPRKLHSNTWL